MIQYIDRLLLACILLLIAGCVQIPKRDAYRNVILPEPQTEIPFVGTKTGDPQAEARLLPNARRIVVAAMKLCQNLNRDPRTCNFQFALYESNATWIRPFNRYIWVTTGLVADVKDDDLFALLLAHEMGHVLAHATTWGWDGKTAAYVDQQRTPMFGGGRPAPVEIEASETTLRDLKVRYSGFPERDALRYSMYLMHIAGYDTKNSAQLWMQYARSGFLAPTHPFLESAGFTLNITREEIMDQEKRGKMLVP